MFFYLFAQQQPDGDTSVGSLLPYNDPLMDPLWVILMVRRGESSHAYTRLRKT
jgi:hypothetical protein